MQVRHSLHSSFCALRRFVLKDAFVIRFSLFYCRKGEEGVLRCPYVSTLVFKAKEEGKKKSVLIDGGGKSALLHN